ncbi:STAS domain-containing protein [Desulfonema limicola]|uniref:STAS domain-containing protein n=1 Tax=Desulfonema limicola TaxID=45656 RepID=A0A975GE89_9BACT|nr:STAS domain-containing protein [Desulfonema limicola]QTA77953.1 STAS domain-containing protein [Desulfonema limicola]
MKVPILKLGHILLTSIQEDLTDQDAVDFQNNVLTTVMHTDASGIVIDITALDVVDSFMARVINETANMVGLLGSEIVVCGMQPSVALTLIEMGRELLGVQTALNLELGLEKIKVLIEKRKTSWTKNQSR